MNTDKAIVVEITDYIKRHFSESLSPLSLAKVVYVSSRELDRIFLAETGMTAMDYVRRIRLTYGAKLLRCSKKTVLEIAMEVGFESVDGFQRAFKFEFGVNPSDYRRNNIPVNLFFPLHSFDLESFSMDDDGLNSVGSFCLSAAYFPERSFLIRRGIKARDLDEYYSEVIDPVSARDCLNMTWGLTLPPAYITPGTSEFVIGSEIKPDEHPELQSGYDVITVPASYFFVFSGKIGDNKMESLYNQYIIKKESDYFNPRSLGYEYDYSIPSFYMIHHNHVRPFILKPVKKA